MKKSLASPLIYVLLTALLLALFTLFLLFFQWNHSFTPGEGINVSGTGPLLPGILASIFIPSSLLGIFLVFLVIMDAQKGRLLSFLFVLGASYLVFVLSIPVLETYSGKGNASDESVMLLEERINTLEEVHLYPGEIAGEYVSGVLVADSEPVRFSLSPGGAVDSASRTFYAEDMEIEYKLPSRNPLFSPLISVPSFLESFIEDLTFFRNSIRGMLGESRQRFLFFSFITILFCVSCSVFTRISRWPVFNVLATLLMFRLLFFLYRILSEEEVGALAGNLSSRINVSQLPVTVMIVLSVIFIVWDLLFTPGRKKKTGA